MGVVFLFVNFENEKEMKKLEVELEEINKEYEKSLKELKDQLRQINQ
jgi:hypothetical protein